MVNLLVSFPCTCLMQCVNPLSLIPEFCLQQTHCVLEYF